MSEFQYRLICQEFITELVEGLWSGESCALLGPRVIGKRYVLHQVAKQLVQNAPGRVIHVDLLCDKTQSQDKNGLHLSQTPEDAQKFHDGDAAIAYIDGLRSSGTSTVWILAHNVDALPHSKARQFLAQLRVRTQDLEAKGRAVAILTGESDLKELVFGEKSEFQCNSYYIVQGFDRNLFQTLLTNHLDKLHLRLADSDADQQNAMQDLYDRTEGNLFYARATLWVAMEHHFVQQSQNGLIVNLDGVTDEEVAARAPGNLHRGYIHRQILQNRATWAILEELVADIPVITTPSQPSVLELNGLVMRSDNGSLRFPGRIVAEILKRHYTRLRFADMYATHGEWEEAFRRYKLLPIEQRQRPTTMEDVADSEQLVNNLSTSLYQEATKGKQAVLDRFVSGCELLMGFEEVTFWRYYDDRWYHDFGQGTRNLLSPTVAYTRSLPGDPAFQEAGIISSLNDDCSVVALLPDTARDGTHAVIVGNPTIATITSSSRRRLTLQLVSDFVAAYRHALFTAATEERLKAHLVYNGIISDIVLKLGSEVLDIGQALELAAQGLSTLGYHRILFSLVSPDREWIEGVYEKSFDHRKSAKSATRFRLDEPKADIQPYVIETCRSMVVPDPLSEPLVNKKLARNAKLQPFAVIPLKQTDGLAIGTLHVELQENRVPNASEMAELEQFTQQLSAVLEQSERVNLLQTALNLVSDPIGILDQSLRLRYVNQGAAAAIGVRTGWYPARVALRHETIHTPSAKRWIQELLPQIIRTKDSGNRHVETIKSLLDDHNPPLAVHLRILTDSIPDWRKLPVGIVCHVHEITNLHRFFEALRAVIDAIDTDQVVTNTIRAIQCLGHSWGLLYKFDDVSKSLVSSQSFGLPLEEVRRRFENKGFEIGKQSDPVYWATWKSLKSGRPIVYCFDPQKTDGEKIQTPHGLYVINAHDPVHHPEFRKQPGEFWIDFPLIANGRWFGKITLSSDPDYQPEDFEILKVLCDMTSRLLERSFCWADEFKNKTEWLERNEEQITAGTVHHIGSLLAPLGLILSRYKNATRRHAAAMKIHADFEQVIRDIQNPLKEMISRLRSFIGKKRRVDLVPVISRAFEGIHSDVEKVIQGPDKLLMDLADLSFLDQLIQMIRNAKEAIHDPASLKMSVTFGTRTRKGQEWVSIRMSDNGPGVPKEKKSRIFEQFFTEHAGRVVGNGLGLFMAKRCVEAHGGEIREVGIFGEGACFEIEMPRFDREIGTSEVLHG